MRDTIDDRLRRLNDEFSKLLSGSSVELESNLQRLVRFGLSKKEAQLWLSKEPNYFISRRKVTDYRWKDETDEEVTEPLLIIFLS
jgi:hypothetical protein